jgi:hypothetical protein
MIAEMLKKALPADLTFFYNSNTGKRIKIESNSFLLVVSFLSFPMPLDYLNRPKFDLTIDKFRAIVYLMNRKHGATYFRDFLRTSPHLDCHGGLVKTSDQLITHSDI